MRLLAALLGSLLLGACGLAPAAPTAFPAPTGPPAQTASTGATATQVPTAPPPTTTPTAMPTPAEPTDFEPPPPPLGRLGASGGAPVEGRLGSWCYQAGCLDGPPPAKETLPLLDLSATASQLVFAMPEAAPFVAWSATYADESLAGDRQLLGRGGPDDPSEPPPGTPALTEVIFAAPSSGDWAVRVSIWFAAGAGDAHYHWHVTMP